MVVAVSVLGTLPLHIALRCPARQCNSDVFAPAHEGCIYTALASESIMKCRHG